MYQEILPTKQSRLEKVQDQFDKWRKNRTKRKPIPKSLWDAAIELHGEYTVHEITKALRLNYTDFKKKITKPEKSSKKKPKTSPTFLEVDFNQHFSPAEYSIEVENSEGAKMKISVKGQGTLNVMDSINQFWKDCK